MTITCHFQQAKRLSGYHTVPSAGLSDTLCPLTFHGPGVAPPSSQFPSEQAALQAQEPEFDAALLFCVVGPLGASGFASL